jgi:hypothetical protein
VVVIPPLAHSSYRKPTAATAMPATFNFANQSLAIQFANAAQIIGKTVRFAHVIFAQTSATERAVG